MRFVLTTCCADKSPDPEPIPAGLRYASPRIEVARALARERCLPLLILSGVFGVLREDDLVPLYDHALLPGEVPGMVPLVVGRLRELGATGLVLVLRPSDAPGWAPYHLLIDAAVAESGLAVERVWVDVE